MNSSLSSQISLAALDALFREALQASLTQLTLPPHVWDNIMRRVQHTPEYTAAATTAVRPTHRTAWSEPVLEIDPRSHVIASQE